MFPRFPKARPWAARSPSAVTNDRFSLRGQQVVKYLGESSKNDLIYKYDYFNQIIMFMFKSEAER